MIKKLAFATVGLTMLGAPLFVVAQTTSTSSENPLIAVLTQLVQVLEQELQQLLAMHGSSTPAVQPTSSTGAVTVTGSSSTQPSSVNFYGAPIPGAGNNPLTITFSAELPLGETVKIDFGDGSMSTALVSGPLNQTCGASATSGGCGIGANHTYSSAGTYTAKLEDSSDNVLATQTITVTDSNSTQPSATIDQSSLTSGSAMPTIAGSAANVPYVRLWIFTGDNTPSVYDSGMLTVTSGRWSTSVTNALQAGTYQVSVYGYGDAAGTSEHAAGILATSTLTVQ